MRSRILSAALLLALVAALPVLAQGNPTAKLTGHVTSEDQPLPGVTVTASSPNLQGTRSTVTSANGDYLFPSLPPGDYTIRFELTGMQPVERPVHLAAAQGSTLDCAMAVAAVSEEIVVTSNLETISEGSQGATTFSKTLVEELPAGRTINEVVNLAPGVSATGPIKDTGTGVAAITIGGAPSYENLFLVNGVVVNENIRGQANDLYIEEAVQETTTSTSGVSAEYGRFSGGVVNVITKSGGNDFSGSFRTTFNNQKWESETPLTTSQRDEIIPTYELGLGGPVMRDRLWFFLAGRDRERTQTLQTASPTNVPYDNVRDQQRYEGKLTLALTPKHSLIGSYIRVDDKENGNAFTPILDTASLVNRETPQKIWSANYTGVMTDNFFLTAQYSKREFTFIGSGATSTDRIDGTLMLDRSRGNGRYHSPTFCGVCKPEHRDNENALLKASYFLSTSSLGSHDIVAGYDAFNDIRKADNHQSGSDFRVFSTGAIIRGTAIYPIFNNDASTIIQYNPILLGSKGTNFRTDSLFVNDSWRFSDHLSFNLGLRYDKNDGEDAEGKKVVKDAAYSPRLAATWDLKGDGDWILHASAGKYVAAIANSIADSSSTGGQPATIQWSYRGPAVNLDPNVANPVSQSDALRILFDWFDANGGPNSAQNRILVDIPGGTTRIRGSLASPNVLEYTLGLSKRLGSRGIVRADYVHRDWADFYVTRRDLSTGRTVGPNGEVDLGFIENNDSAFERTYDGLQTQFRYKASAAFDFGGNWTLSKLEGNFDGENRGSGPLTGDLTYPEYSRASWTRPKGDLSADQRHKVNLYGIWRPIHSQRQTLSVSLLQSYLSGRPYSAAGTIRTAAYVTNPGYVTVPTRVTYFFSARGAYTTDDIYRTDFAVNYSVHLGPVELYLQPEILNVFNGQGVDTNDSSFFNTTVFTADNTGATSCSQAGPGGTPGRCLPFNPFTETPVEGVHYQKGPSFGKPVSPFGYQVPRTYRFAVGVRF